MNSVDLTADLQALLTCPNVRHNLSAAQLTEKVLSRNEAF